MVAVCRDGGPSARGDDYRVYDLRVPGAATDVAAQGLDDLVALDRTARALDQRMRRHQHPGSAEAALRRVPIGEGALNRRQLLRRAQPLQRGDLCSLEVRNRQ